MWLPRKQEGRILSVSHVNYRHKEGFGHQHQRKGDIKGKEKSVFQKQIHYFRMSHYFVVMLVFLTWKLQQASASWDVSN